MQFLWQMAHATVDQPSLSAFYVNKIRQLAKEEHRGLARSVEQRWCCRCSSLRVELLTSTTHIKTFAKKTTKKRKFNENGNEFKVACSMLNDAEKTLFPVRVFPRISHVSHRKNNQKSIKHVVQTCLTCGAVTDHAGATKQDLRRVHASPISVATTKWNIKTPSKTPDNAQQHFNLSFMKSTPEIQSTVTKKESTMFTPVSKRTPQASASPGPVTTKKKRKHGRSSELSALLDRERTEKESSLKPTSLTAFLATLQKKA